MIMKKTIRNDKLAILFSTLILIPFSILAMPAQARAEDQIQKQIQAPSTTWPRESLYQLTDKWKNQEGQEIRMQSFAGQWVVMAMTYTGCQYSCPMTINKLKNIENEFKNKGIQNYHFVVASFDAEKDTPEQLKKTMQKRGIAFEKWTFLSAPSDSEVRKLAVLLEINYQKLDDGDFSHSNAIALLDSEGRIQTKLKGLGSPNKELIEKVASKAGSNQKQN